MATLTFDPAEVLKVIEHALGAPKHRHAYDFGEKKQPAVAAIWLVGDDGVYIMSNGDPWQENPLYQADVPVGERKKAAEPKVFAAYADGMDPRKVAFEQWWEAKRGSFGADDGCNPIEISDEMLNIARGCIEKKRSFTLDITPNSVGVYVVEESPARLG